jgi:hypothetical protein
MENWVKEISQESVKFKNGHIQISVHILFEKQDDVYIAHCLECDITAEGPTIKTAQKNIIDCIKDHVEFCIEMGNIDKIIDRAPKEYWDKLLYSRPLERFKFPAPPDMYPDFGYPIKDVDTFEVECHA